MVSAKRCKTALSFSIKRVRLGGKHFEQANHLFAESGQEQRAWSECQERDNLSRSTRIVGLGIVAAQHASGAHAFAGKT
jgi:hypothetical protein